MPIILRGGPLNGQPWPGTVADADRRISTRIGMGERVVYVDTEELDPATGQRIFAYQPPKPKPSGEAANPDLGDDDDEE